MNEFLDKMNLKENRKGGLYHGVTFDANLDVFALNARFLNEEDAMSYFTKAYLEDSDMFLKNVLNMLDIRDGKGERNAFKMAFKFLITRDIKMSLIVLHAIQELGRWDYIFVGIGTDIENDVISLIKKEFEGNDMTLLFKWMPSITTSSKDTVKLARKLASLLLISEKSYRQFLSKGRKRLKLIETYLSERNYTFDYSKVPSKAMLKYIKAFQKNDASRIKDFIGLVDKGEKKINTKGLTPGLIVSHYMDDDEALMNVMWKNLKDIDMPKGTRALPIIDTSGSMGALGYDGETAPINQSVGIGLYLAERGIGAFKNTFMTFSATPRLELIQDGLTLKDKLTVIKKSDWGMNTNIDAVFKLILNATIKSKADDCPTHVVIISDMEFDGCQNNQEETNFVHWKNKFGVKGLKLPKIIFWNVSGRTNGGFPTTSIGENVAMVSGYGTGVINNLFTLDKLNPVLLMKKELKKYDKYLGAHNG